MRFITPMLLVALAATPAMAQGKGHSRRDDTKANTEVSSAKRKAADEAYQRALKSIPESKIKVDPWQGSR